MNKQQIIPEREENSEKSQNSPEYSRTGTSPTAQSDEDAWKQYLSDKWGYGKNSPTHDMVWQAACRHKEAQHQEQKVFFEIALAALGKEIELLKSQHQQKVRELVARIEEERIPVLSKGFATSRDG